MVSTASLLIEQDTLHTLIGSEAVDLVLVEDHWAVCLWIHPSPIDPLAVVLIKGPGLEVGGGAHVDAPVGGVQGEFAGCGCRDWS